MQLVGGAWPYPRSWPDRRRRCRLRGSFRPPPRRWASRPGLSWRAAARLHWCSRYRPARGDSTTTVTRPSPRKTPARQSDFYSDSFFFFFFKLDSHPIGRPEQPCLLTKRMRQSTDSNEFRRKRTLSKTLKASLISSSLSVSFIFRAIMVRNSGKSIVPLPTRTHRKEMTRPSNNRPLPGSMRCVPRVRRGLRRSRDSGPHRQRPPHWSCLGVRPRWGSVPASAWQFRALWWWWCRLRPCRTVRTPLWTLEMDTDGGVRDFAAVDGYAGGEEMRWALKGSHRRKEQAFTHTKLDKLFFFFTNTWVVKSIWNHGKI